MAIAVTDAPSGAGVVIRDSLTRTRILVAYDELMTVGLKLIERADTYRERELRRQGR